MSDVVALGDVNVDIIAHFDSYPDKGQDALAYSTEFHCGGSAANTAIALARMGLDVVLISRVGPDSLALKALNSLSEAGVTPTGLQRDPAAMTGLMYVVVTPDGERTILGHRGANALTDPQQVREEDIRDARLFHLSGYALLTEPQRSAALLALEMACRHGLLVTLDPGMTVSEAALDEIIGAWCQSRTAAEIEALLREAGVCVATVAYFLEIYRTPAECFTGRDYLVPVTHPESGTHGMPTLPWRYPNEPAGEIRYSPCFGEHSWEVLQKELGISDSVYADLEARGITGIPAS